MEEEGIEINDMYNYVCDVIDMNKLVVYNVDLFFFDWFLIYEYVIEVIFGVLD